MRRTLLFLCTGNYYRSRFAESLFNDRAVRRSIAWRARSRALALERGRANVGPIARDAVERLLALGIPAGDLERARPPLAVAPGDLDTADRIIALDEAEHRPLVTGRYGAWADRIEYWNIVDVPPSAAYDPLRLMKDRIESLLEQLA